MKYLVRVQYIDEDEVKEFTKDFETETEARIYVHIKKTYTTNKYTFVELYEKMEEE